MLANAVRAPMHRLRAKEGGANGARTETGGRAEIRGHDCPPFCAHTGGGGKGAMGRGGAQTGGGRTNERGRAQGGGMATSGRWTPFVHPCSNTPFARKGGGGGGRGARQQEGGANGVGAQQGGRGKRVLFVPPPMHTWIHGDTLFTCCFHLFLLLYIYSVEII